MQQVYHEFFAIFKNIPEVQESQQFLRRGN